MEHTPAAVRSALLLAAVAVILVAATLVAGRAGLLGVEAGPAVLAVGLAVGLVAAVAVLARVSSTLGLR